MYLRPKDVCNQPVDVKVRHLHPSAEIGTLTKTIFVCVGSVYFLFWGTVFLILTASYFYDLNAWGLAGSPTIRSYKDIMSKRTNNQQDLDISRQLPPNICVRCSRTFHLFHHQRDYIYRYLIVLISTGQTILPIADKMNHCTIASYFLLSELGFSKIVNQKDAFINVSRPLIFAAAANKILFRKKVFLNKIILRSSITGNKTHL